ncbi:MAG: hypothetical protein ACO2PN_24920 [Pyrobaculum sp.]
MMCVSSEYLGVIRPTAHVSAPHLYTATVRVLLGSMKSSFGM